MADINNKTLEHLYALARIEPETDKAKRTKLLSDMTAILKHFEELQEVDTTDVEPLAGGGFLSNISREDMPEPGCGDTGYCEPGHLKVPSVF